MAGRKPKYQEFLITLRDLSDTSNAELAKLTGKKAANISAYMSGAKVVGKSSVRSAVRHLSEWHVTEDQTMLPLANKASICTHPGVYFIYDSAGNCVYIGQAKNLRTEVSQRLSAKKLRHGIWRDRKLKRTRYAVKDVAAFVSTYRVDSPRLRHNLEALFLRAVINQTQNAKLGKFR